MDDVIQNPVEFIGVDDGETVINTHGVDTGEVVVYEYDDSGNVIGWHKEPAS